MRFVIALLLAIVFLLTFFRMDALIFPTLMVTGIGLLIYYGFERPQDGDGWWRKGRDPGPTPAGPGPLPSEWEPPDYIPEWMLIEDKLKKTEPPPPDPDPEGRRLEPLRLGATAGRP